MNRAEQFLELYKQLEELLRLRYDTGSPSSRRENAIHRFISSQEGRRFRDELDLCREVRNLLSHRAQFEGESPVMPAESLITFLSGLVAYLADPPNALCMATKTEELLLATKESKLDALLALMEKKGYSHVPVPEGKRLYGVFSTGVFGAYFREHPSLPLGADAKMATLYPYLPITRHACEQYAFVSADTAYETVRQLFASKGPRKKRMAAVFVTKNGGKDERLLGMITPWDVLKFEPDF